MAKSKLLKNKKKLAKKQQKNQVKKKRYAEKNKPKEAKEVEQLLLQTLRGMKDILPEDQPFWEQARRASEKLARDYGYVRIDTPLVEYSNLFVRGIGDGTDIVEKEMYNFVTRGGDKVSLRPEMTAGIARAFIQHGMNVWPSRLSFFQPARFIVMIVRRKVVIANITN